MLAHDAQGHAHEAYEAPCEPGTWCFVEPPASLVRRLHAWLHASCFRRAMMPTDYASETETHVDLAARRSVVRRWLGPTGLAFALTACGPEAPAPSIPHPSAQPTPTAAPSTAPSAVPPAVPSVSTVPSGPAASAAEDKSGTPRDRLMRSHFREVALLRTAVIDGKLADAVAPADALSRNEGLGKIEPSWQSSIDVLEYAAKRIQHGSDIPAAAAAVADIGIACGACHKAAGGPKAKIEAAPAAGPTLENRMRRHVWATERLWEGIYVPSDASWKAGADALTGDPFPKEVVDKGGVHGRSAADKLKSIVATLGSKKTPQDRGQAYASLLETCSACHVVTRTAKK